MSNGAAKPKPAFFIAVAVVVAGLIALAVMRCKGKSESTDPGKGSVTTGSDGTKQTGPGPGVVENPGDGKPIPGLTADKYDYEPSTTLPPVPGTSGYTALGKTRVVKFAVNVWAGWAPIVWANQGHKAGKIWKDAKGNDFQIELQLADDPVAMGNLVANGTHIGWATVDMLPLIIERLKKDQRTMPRVFQQIDWSNGGDGIVARNTVKEVSDLRGKTVVLAQNSPSHYFLLSMAQNAGIKFSEVSDKCNSPNCIKLKFTKDAFQAAQAYNQNQDIAACVSWAPDIYTLTDNPASGNKLLVTTGTANKLIADVWFARADFARDNPDIIEGIVRGILDSERELTGSDQNKAKVGEMLDKFYNLPGGTGGKMLADAHWTNYAENRDFFLVANNPTNFERTYNAARDAYVNIGVLPRSDLVDFDKIMDFSVIKKLGGEEKYASQKNTYEFNFTPKNVKDINVESTIVTKTVTVNFFPNSFDIFKKVPASAGGGDVYYDGKVEYTVEEIAKLAGQFGAARIVISGHTDSSMKGTADPQLVKDLSENRARAVKDGLLKKFPKLDPNQITTTGYGWEKPADPKDPDNHSKNRRVEVRVVPAEAQ
jgi:ABC-type nitrate/sulfonate/bicarbonate transport system substrate-binding protein